MLGVLGRNYLVEPMPLQVYNSSEFRFPSPRPVAIVMLKEPNLPNYCWRENTWIHAFLKNMKMQTALSRIWTRVAMSTSYDDNLYVMSASLL